MEKLAEYLEMRIHTLILKSRLIHEDRTIIHTKK